MVEDCILSRHDVPQGRLVLRHNLVAHAFHLAVEFSLIPEFASTFVALEPRNALIDTLLCA